MGNDLEKSSQKKPLLNLAPDNPALANASHLEQWSDVFGENAITHFPQLILRLLIEILGQSNISIPHGTGVFSPGYDGTVSIKKSNGILPEGEIVFEFGTGKNPHTKADADYIKRTNYIKRTKKASSDEIFVFITSRRWTSNTSKKDWARKKQEEEIFKQVIAFDADDLEAWLLLAPGTHVWVSRELGLHPDEVTLLEQRWEEISRSTTPKLPLELFTAGRDSKARNLFSLLRKSNEQPRKIILRSKNKDDAIAFITATLEGKYKADFKSPKGKAYRTSSLKAGIQNMRANYAKTGKWEPWTAALGTHKPDEEFPTPIKTPTYIIHSPQAWERFTEKPSERILIPDFDEPDIDSAIKSGQQVIEILDSNASKIREADVDLPPIKCAEAALILSEIQEKKVDCDRATYLALLAQHSIPALKREIQSSRKEKPRWSTSTFPNRHELTLLMLAGKWTDGTKYRDLYILSKLANIPKKDLEKIIHNEIQNDDPAIYKEGHIFQFLSPKEAFLELSENISQDLRSEWVEIASEILLKSALPKGINNQQMTTAQEKSGQDAYSPELRKGIASSLALGGATADAIKSRCHGDNNASNITEIVEMTKEIVKNILTQVVSDKDDHNWLEIADILPLLAEAAPDIFIEKLEDDFYTNNPPTVAQLFEVSSDSSDTTATSNKQHYLFFALEILSWEGEYLTRIIQILTRLCQYDRDNAAHTPLKSISNILLNQSPWASSNLRDRLNAVETCRRLDPSIALKLLENLTSRDETAGAVSSPQQPLYQSYIPNNINSTFLRSQSRWTRSNLRDRLKVVKPCRRLNPPIDSKKFPANLTSRDETAGAVSSPQQPLYQSYIPNNIVGIIPKVDRKRFIRELLEIAVKWTDKENSNIPWLITTNIKAGGFLLEYFDIIGFLEEKVYEDELAKDIFLDIFEKVYDIETVNGVDQTVPETRKKYLSRLVKSPLLINDLRRYICLFDEDFEYVGTDEDYAANIQAEQHNAFDNFFKQPDGLNQLEAVTKRAKAPRKVGLALATYEPFDVLELMLKWLDSENSSLREAATAWSGAYLKVKDSSVLRNILVHTKITENARNLLVLSIPKEHKFWNILDAFPSDKDFFWRNADFLSVPEGDFVQTIENLLEKDRPWMAVKVAGHKIAECSLEVEERTISSLLLKVFSLAAVHTSNLAGMNNKELRCYLTVIFSYLQKINTSIDDLANLEFEFFDFLNPEFYFPLALDQKFSSDPKFFVNLIRLAHFGGDDFHDQSAKFGAKVDKILLILKNLDGFPGKKQDGGLDEDAMNSWVASVREQLSDLELANIGDEIIGRFFAYTPLDRDGFWPSRHICKLIEELQSSSFDEGIYRGCLDARYRPWRGYDITGGLTLAEDYKNFSFEVQDRWPRAASILRKIARSHEEAERRRRD